MLENSPLLGSCESTLLEKKKLAVNSLEFNLKNETFCELFPDEVQEIKTRLEKMNEIKKQNEKEALEKAAHELNQLDSSSNNPTAYNLCFNVIIVVIFGVFICIVKKIYESGDQDE
jgi:ubiquitin-conjugating enzyme E2 J2